jgi:hypothetical protein
MHNYRIAQHPGATSFIQVTAEQHALERAHLNFYVSNTRVISAPWGTWWRLELWNRQSNHWTVVARAEQIITDLAQEEEEP